MYTLPGLTPSPDHYVLFFYLPAKRGHLAGFSFSTALTTEHITLMSVEWGIKKFYIQLMTAQK
jgi:hypothetical protein